MIAAFALTEPSAGSDAAGIKTKAVRDGEHWILNGEKIWIQWRDCRFLHHLCRTEGKEGQMTAFIVTRDMPGVSTGPHEDKMGIRGSSTTSVTLENVRVTNDEVLGEVGKGLRLR